ncbi:hypothetical protein ABC383_09260 [Noviherbaspirillum sp. 1P10PC]|uniref:hypothetical protein n=1 Tax=Noviherbaspirillum sp. 1P10PC TaxID=3132292 RepID=UPI00399FF1CB
MISWLQAFADRCRERREEADACDPVAGEVGETDRGGDTGAMCLALSLSAFMLAMAIEGDKGRLCILGKPGRDPCASGLLAESISSSADDSDSAVRESTSSAVTRSDVLPPSVLRRL